MNNSIAVFLINDACRGIQITYEDYKDAPRTFYKSFDQSIKVGHFVVIPTDTRHGMTVCKVVAVDVEPDLETLEHVEWIIGTVNTADAQAIKEQENMAIVKINSAKKTAARIKLREELLADVGSAELKALPIFGVGDVGELPVVKETVATED